MRSTRRIYIYISCNRSRESERVRRERVEIKKIDVCELQFFWDRFELHLSFKARNESNLFNALKIETKLK